MYYPCISVKAEAITPKAKIFFMSKIDFSCWGPKFSENIRGMMFVGRGNRYHLNIVGWLPKATNSLSSKEGKPEKGRKELQMEKNSLKGLMARYEQRNAGIKLTGVTLTKTGVDKLMYRLKDVIKLTTQRSISGAYIDFHMLNQNIVIDISEGYESKKKNIKTYGSISVQFIPDIVGYEQGQLPYEANPIFATQVVGEDVVPAELSEKVHDGSIEDIRALFFEDYPSVIDWILENGEEFARQLKEMVTLKTCRVYQKQDDGSLKEMIAFRTYQEYEKTCEKLGKEEKEEKPKK